MTIAATRSRLPQVTATAQPFTSAALRLCLSLLAISMPLHVQAQWRSASEEGGIKVEARSLPGERFDELRVSTVVPVAPQTVADFLVGDYLDQKNSNIRRTFAQRGPKLTVWSDVVKPPAVSARCYSMRFERMSLPNDGGFKVRFSTGDYIGPKPDPDCIQLQSRGEWTMARVAGGTRLIYVSLTDVGGGTPAVLVRRSLTSAAVQSVKKVKAGAIGLDTPRTQGQR